MASESRQNGSGDVVATTMSTLEPLLAKERDIQDIDTLLCSAQKPIGLSQNFCASENRPKRLGWFREKLAHNLLWVIRDRDGLAGVLILEQDLCAQVVGIAYIAVAERMRDRRKLGQCWCKKLKHLPAPGSSEPRRGMTIVGGCWKVVVSKGSSGSHI
jgi:hypothetical protein